MNYVLIGMNYVLIGVGIVLLVLFGFAMWAMGAVSYTHLTLPTTPYV